jgi:Protein of unknown function (DUF3300)
VKSKFLRIVAAGALPLPLLLSAPGLVFVAPVAAYAQDAAQLGQGQLDAILAPVALYPDTLLTQVLMAATYPDEVADANTWLQDSNNAALKGNDLVAALDPQPWDPSIKALVPFPQILNMLATHTDWAVQLGQAFTNQQAQVMAEVQNLRHEAQRTGKLQSTPQLVVQDQGGAIVITPADPALLYVPVYNPAVVYGAWAYPAYPPVFFAPPVGFVVGGLGIGVGIGFSVGFGIVGPLWGWAHPIWGAGIINVDIGVWDSINRSGPHWAGGPWHHIGHGPGYFHGPHAPLHAGAHPGPRSAPHHGSRASFRPHGGQHPRPGSSHPHATPHGGSHPGPHGSPHSSDHHHI